MGESERRSRSRGVCRPKESPRYIYVHPWETFDAGPGMGSPWHPSALALLERECRASPGHLSQRPLRQILLDVATAPKLRKWFVSQHFPARELEDKPHDRPRAKPRVLCRESSSRDCTRRAFVDASSEQRARVLSLSLSSSLCRARFPRSARLEEWNPFKPAPWRGQAASSENAFWCVFRTRARAPRPPRARSENPCVSSRMPKCLDPYSEYPSLSNGNVLRGLDDKRQVRLAQERFAPQERVGKQTGAGPERRPTRRDLQRSATAPASTHT